MFKSCKVALYGIIHCYSTCICVPNSPLQYSLFLGGNKSTLLGSNLAPGLLRAIVLLDSPEYLLLLVSCKRVVLLESLKCEINLKYLLRALITQAIEVRVLFNEKHASYNCSVDK